MESALNHRPLKLRAEDAEDLAVLAACLQDAVVLSGDMAYEKSRRRFAFMANRYVWEQDRGTSGEPHARIRCGVHFDGVLGVSTKGLSRADKARPLELLTIACEEGEHGAAVLNLIFAGGRYVRLDAECIEGALSDVGEPWTAPHRPRHPEMEPDV